MHMLVIDDDTACCRTLQLHYSSRGFEVLTANSAEEGAQRIAAGVPDIVISDVRMPGQDGISLLEDIRGKYPGIAVIMITAFQDLETTVEALHKGAVDFVGKPIDLEELDAAVNRAVTIHSDDRKDALVIDLEDANATIIGRSRPMQEVFKAIGKVSQSRVTVLLSGESGTGKELIARAIHKSSKDRDKPFIAINCAAIVETLLESELFGHERGAFTGAVNARKGKAELAGEGVLFLDEVGELSPRMQGKLLRLLEAREFTPVGGDSVRACKARFVAATNADLKAEVAEGNFREDLFYRLSVFNIHSPSLRERRDDIPLLIEHLLKRISCEIHKVVRRVTAEALVALQNYEWPGNVRQLSNVLMQSVVMAQDDVLTHCDLPLEIAGETAASAECANAARGMAQTPCPPSSLKDLERGHIAQVLLETRWHKGKACEILGISRPRLDRRIKEYGLVQSSP